MKTLTNKQLDNRGFSLVEIMIVIAIMGMLMAIAVPKVMGSFERAKQNTTRIQIKNLENSLKSYRLDCGTYPTSDQGLDALRAKPTVGADCKNYAPGGYIDNLPKDGWGRDFIYSSDGNDYEIKSLGQDGKEGGTGYGATLSSKDAP